MKLRVRNLNSYHGRAHILFDVNLAVNAGEVVALLGRNGAGKSTTLRSILGLVPERRGRVHLDGVDISGWPVHRVARTGLGYVPEDRRIFTDLTVGENLMVGQKPPREGRPSWSRERIHALFPNLAGMENRPAAQVDALHLGIAAHLPRGAAGDDRSLVHDHDPVGVGKDHVHVVFGEKHGNAPVGDDAGGQPH